MAIAALFAFLTVSHAVVQWRLTRQGAAYDLVVLDPIRLAADEFIEVSGRLITDGVQQVKTSTGEKEVTRAVGRLIEDFNAAYYTFKNKVSRAARVWPVDDLFEVHDQVLAVQDRITLPLAALPDADVDFADELNEAVTDVIAVVLQHAPVLKKDRLRRLRGWADQEVAIARSDDRRKRIRRRWSRVYDGEVSRHLP